jgi:hypothetical protein
VISSIILGLSLVANVVLIWTIICDKDDIDQLEYENEKLALAIDKLLYKENKNVRVNEEA